MRPRVFLIGKNGQIGRELAQMLGGTSELGALGRQELDLTKPQCVRQAIRQFQPHFILNAAAYTAVDNAEREEALAQSINADAPAAMAEEAKKIGAALIHYSTDYVFDGSKSSPYLEDDPTNPLSAYGRTKLAGERAIEASGCLHLTFRTEWVYANQGKNFLMTILRLACEREDLRIVADQIGAPTWSREIAAATVKIIMNEWRQTRGEDIFVGSSGIYHMTAAGQTSWFEFARAILDAVRGCPRRPSWLEAAIGNRPLMVKQVLPMATKDYVTAARRPAYSVLSNEKMKRVFGVNLPDWRIQLRTALGIDQFE